jgi:hypothetical protein
MVADNNIEDDVVFGCDDENCTGTITDENDER